MIIKLEEVKHTHKCNDCDKKLYGPRHKIPSMRICILSSKYCIYCGYSRAVTHKDELERLIQKMKDKFGKELVVDRLSKK